jgi:hypothetical protein
MERWEIYMDGSMDGKIVPFRRIDGSNALRIWRQRGSGEEVR